MSTYIILSRIAPDAFRFPKDLKGVADAVSTKIKEECPGLKWIGSYATLGRYDVIDIVEADDPRQVEKAVMLIRAYGHSSTETMCATPWKEFLATL